MENKMIGCNEIAESIKSLMTIANFSGYINQADGEPLRQYSVSPVTGGRDSATMLLDFAGHKFKLDISYAPNYGGGK